MHKVREKTREVKVVFEDDYLCVIDKPWGVVVNDSVTTSKRETVQNWFKNKLIISDSESEFMKKGGVVHRLDKDTSGLLVLAKSQDVYEKLKKQFLERRVLKTYLALVHGEMKEAEGIINLPIERNPKVWGKFSIGKDLSLMAITEWKFIKLYKILGGEYSLLELKPMTGRTHQLRVHLKHLAHPIVGDPIYLNGKMLEEDKKWCWRLFLHAHKLEFVHPISKETIKFDSPLPLELRDTLDM